MFAFDDPTGNLGRMAYNLGNVYRSIGVEPGNASALFIALQNPFPRITEYKESVTEEQIRHTLKAIDAAMAPLGDARSTSPDADLTNREFRFSAHTLRHACYRMLSAFGIEEKSKDELGSDMDDIMREHEAVWLARNRPGGLADSMERFQRSKMDYQ
jgi:hypothetical protein